MLSSLASNASEQTEVVIPNPKREASQSTRPPTLRVAERPFGGYRPAVPLAVRGFAAEFLGFKEQQAGRPILVAVHVVHPHLMSHREGGATFVEEALRAADLDSPHILRVLEAKESKSGTYQVTEYVEGASLTTLLGTSVPPRDRVAYVLTLALDILQGLETAHEAGVVHQGVSPHNVTLGVDGCARLSYFGGAPAEQCVASEDTQALANQCAYLAPEQLMRDGEGRIQTTPSTDIFAVGSLLWRALAGKSLFEGPDISSTEHNVLYAEIPSLLDHCEYIGPEVNEVICRALSRDPKARFQSAADMLEALTSAIIENGLLASRAELAEWVRCYHGPEIGKLRSAVMSDWRGSQIPPQPHKAVAASHKRIRLDVCEETTEDKPLQTPVQHLQTMLPFLKAYSPLQLKNAAVFTLAGLSLFFSVSTFVVSLIGAVMALFRLGIFA